MDDHPPTVSQDSSSADAEPLLDSVTAELKAEFARLELEGVNDQSAQTVTSDLGLTNFTAELHFSIQRATLSRVAERIRRLIASLEKDCQFSRSNLQQRRKIQFWTAALESVLETLAKLSTLFAHVLQAILRTPLLLDGPELSGYKHRLR